MKDQNIYILYTDDSILVGPDPQKSDNIIQQMKDVKPEVSIEGDISDFFRVKISRQDDSTIHMNRPYLIESILKELHLERTPAAASKLLKAHKRSEAFDEHFNYRRVIGQFNYLEKSTRPDIAYTVCTCARFV